MRRIILAAATIGAAVVAVTGAATAASHTKIEHFSLIDVSPGPPLFSVIATGAFTAGGTYDNLTHTLRFQDGAIKFAASHGTIKTTGTLTCLPGESPLHEPELTEASHGTYTIEGGTGAYKGIKGSGTTVGKVTLVDGSIHGKCASEKPAAAQIVTDGSGPVSLP
jgi:hypothetical protein